MSVIGVTRSSRAWIGVAVAIAAGAAFAIANTSAGVAYQSGSNPLTVASTRFLLPTVALIAWLGFTGVPLVLPRREAIVAVLLGALTALYNWALLGSFNSIPFALAVLIVLLSSDSGRNRCDLRVGKVCLENWCGHLARHCRAGHGARRSRRQPKCYRRELGLCCGGRACRRRCRIKPGLWKR